MFPFGSREIGWKSIILWFWISCLLLLSSQFTFAPFSQQPKREISDLFFILKRLVYKLLGSGCMTVLWQSSLLLFVLIYLLFLFSVWLLRNGVKHGPQKNLPLCFLFLFSFLVLGSRRSQYLGVIWDFWRNWSLHIVCFASLMYVVVCLMHMEFCVRSAWFSENSHWIFAVKLFNLTLHLSQQIFYVEPWWKFTCIFNYLGDNS